MVSFRRYTTVVINWGENREIWTVAIRWCSLYIFLPWEMASVQGSTKWLTVTLTICSLLQHFSWIIYSSLWKIPLFLSNLWIELPNFNGRANSLLDKWQGILPFLEKTTVQILLVTLKTPKELASEATLLATHTNNKKTPWRKPDWIIMGFG